MQDRLLERIRAALPQDVSVREITMFGGRTFMVNEKLAVSAGRDGKLHVHVRPEDQAELLRREEASQAEMGKAAWARAGSALTNLSSLMTRSWISG